MMNIPNKLFNALLLFNAIVCPALFVKSLFDDNYSVGFTLISIGLTAWAWYTLWTRLGPKADRE